MISFAATHLHDIILSQVAQTDHLFLMFFTILTVCYLIGSVSPSYVLTKWLTGVDLRSYGSGNSGATNASRLLGFQLFCVIVLIDAGKAYAGLSLSSFLLPELSEFGLLICAGMILVGNAFSIFMRFRGGKSVATSLGLLLYFFPLSIVGIYAACFLVILAIGRRVDGASLGAAGLGALYVAFLATVSFPLVCAAGVLAAWIWMRHWKNIVYLCGRSSQF